MHVPYKYSFDLPMPISNLYQNLGNVVKIMATTFKCFHMMHPQAL